MGVGGDGADPGWEFGLVKGSPVGVVDDAGSGIKVGGGGRTLIVVVGEVVVDGVLRGRSSDGDGDNGTVSGRSSGGMGTVIVGGSGSGGRAFRYGVPVAERVLFRGRWWLWIDGFSGHGIRLLGSTRRVSVVVKRVEGLEIPLVELWRCVVDGRSSRRRSRAGVGLGGSELGRIRVRQRL